MEGSASESEALSGWELCLDYFGNECRWNQNTNYVKKTKLIYKTTLDSIKKTSDKDLDKIYKPQFLLPDWRTFINSRKWKTWYYLLGNKLLFTLPIVDNFEFLYPSNRWNFFVSSQNNEINEDNVEISLITIYNRQWEIKNTFDFAGLDRTKKETPKFVSNKEWSSYAFVANRNKNWGKAFADLCSTIVKDGNFQKNSPCSRFAYTPAFVGNDHIFVSYSIEGSSKSIFYKKLYCEIKKEYQWYSPTEREIALTRNLGGKLYYAFKDNPHKMEQASIILKKLITKYKDTPSIAYLIFWTEQQMRLLPMGWL